ncbi:CDGSH iron-sulfur domain-containing protein [Cryobacterium sp. GrIS_2_6]|uniref:CDGSH iron-sulfur domain-containing protein n=1 Tax=Cryobacterium sp. GrIS_2_6 TaxID=3162785 RepID=UPI002E160C1C|nr:CDGSH iron-sulfur domain-containing protein [Cryobacterium psychrotolerans]
MACANGPVLVRGNVVLVSATGDPIAPNRKTVALCRCGASTTKPFCDGTHKLVHFVTDLTPEKPAGPG